MDSQDCGPACLKMIAKHYGKYYSLQYLRDICGVMKEGVTFLNLCIGAEKIGLRTLAVRCTINDLHKIKLPIIIFWEQNHFIVVYHLTKRHIHVSDPAKGKIKYTHEEFTKGWYPDGESMGVLSAVEPMVNFKDSEAQKEIRKYKILTCPR